MPNDGARDRLLSAKFLAKKANLRQIYIPSRMELSFMVPLERPANSAQDFSLFCVPLSRARSLEAFYELVQVRKHGYSLQKGALHSGCAKKVNQLQLI